jgi:hypothetical protein
MGRGLITAAQLENAIDEGIPYEYKHWKTGEVEQSSYEGSEFWSEAHYSEPNYEVASLDVTLSHVDGEHGGEGSAEYIWQVWKTVDAEGNVQYFKKEGYYMSYDGSNWDGELFEVEPFEKTVTDWKVKK